MVERSKMSRRIWYGTPRQSVRGLARVLCDKAMTYFVWQGEDALLVAFAVRHHDAQETHNNILLK